MARWAPRTTEGWLALVLVLMIAGLGLSTDSFFTLLNAFDLLNQNAVNLIFAVGLLAVLVAGGIDISFAVGASGVPRFTMSTPRQSGSPWA